MLTSTMTKPLPAINSNTPLTLDEIRIHAPSVFATAPHQSRTSRYGFIPTANILRALMDRGFNIHGVAQRRTRTPDRRHTTLHRVVLRHESSLGTEEPEVPQIVLMNDHMGLSCFHMFAGLFRFVCANGLIVGQTCSSISIPHSKNAVSRVIDGVYEIVETFDKIRERRKAMQEVELTEKQQNEFARRAAVLRYPNNPPFDPKELLVARRPEDEGPSLWSVFNRVQENLTKGGILLTAPTGKRRTRTRALTSLALDTKMNRGLWDLAEDMLKAA